MSLVVGNSIERDYYLYYVRNRTLYGVLKGIIEKARSIDWRVIVFFEDEKAMREFDSFLWREPDNSFFPHGMVIDLYPEQQNVLLSCHSDLLNRPDIVIFAGLNIHISLDKDLSLKRICYVFQEVSRNLCRCIESMGEGKECFPSYSVCHSLFNHGMNESATNQGNDISAGDVKLWVEDTRTGKWELADRDMMKSLLQDASRNMPGERSF